MNVIYIKYEKEGASLEPWGTPVSIVRKEDFVSLYSVYWERLVK